MVAEPRTTRPIAIDLSRSAQWTVHHVLLDRIEQVHAAGSDGESNEVPPISLYRAFDRLDDGMTRFSIEELEEIQAVLADYHRSTTAWENERAEIESVLATVATAIEEYTED